MSGSPVSQYLEKYSVAPSPSRDYHGVKVFDEKVIFYTWRVSHGPHTHPVVRIARFDDFFQDRVIQDDIQRIFGYPMFRHVEAIVKGRGNTLLTLSKNLMVKLINYLGIKDVVNLSTLSLIANEVFNADSVWEVLYRRQKMGLLYKDERERARLHGWKELFKERQMHKPVKDRKLKKASSLRDFPSQRPGTSIKSSSSTASFSALKERKLVTEVERANRKSDVEIEAAVSLIAGSNPRGKILVDRCSEDTLAKRSSRIKPRLDLPPANDILTSIVKAASICEIAGQKLDKKTPEAEKTDEIRGQRPKSSRAWKTEGKNVREKGSVISVKENSGSKDSLRMTSAGDFSEGSSNRKSPIGQRKLPAVYDRFPTPRKPVTRDSGGTKKFEQVKNFAGYNRGEKSLVIGSKLLEGINATRKLKSRESSSAEANEGCCNSLKSMSSFVGSSRRGRLTNKREKINKKTKK